MRPGILGAVLVGAVGVGQAGCAGRQPLPQVDPARLSAAGDTVRFGPGIAGMTPDGRHVRLRLTAPANVLFYNVHPDGWAELLGSARLSNGEREFVVPLTAGQAGSGAGLVPFVACSPAGRTATDRAASAARCAEVRAAADSRAGASMRVSRSPRAGYRDALVVLVWDITANDPQLLAPDYGAPRLFDADRPVEALAPVVLRRAVAWAAYGVAP